MRTLARVAEFLRTLPQGYPADGRMLGVGLATALQAQQTRQARQARTIEIPRTRSGDDEDRFTRAA